MYEEYDKKCSKCGYPENNKARITYEQHIDVNGRKKMIPVDCPFCIKEIAQLIEKGKIVPC